MTRARLFGGVFLTFAAVTLLLYGRTLNAPFVFDSLNLRETPLIQISRIGEISRILVYQGLPRRIGWASFALSFYFGGLEPFWFRLVNLMLHAANATLIVALVVRVLGLPKFQSRPESRALAVAGAGAGFWLVHPVQTQAVTYVYQRFTGLATFFFLLAILLYLSGRVSSGYSRWLLLTGCLASGLLSLLTKENSGSLPLVLLSVEILLVQEKPPQLRRLDWRAGAFVLAIGLAFATICIVYLGPNFIEMMAGQYQRRGFTLTERLLTEGRVVVYYLSLLLYPNPSRLELDYDVSLSKSLLMPPTTLLSLMVIALLLGYGFRVWRYRPGISFAIFWFFGNLAIESTIIPLDLAYEHRLYLPTVAPAVLLASWLLVASERRRWIVSAGIALACLWSFWSFQRNELWRDPVKLWQDNAVKSPNRARVRVNLAKAYLDRGDYPSARRELERAIELAPSMTGARVALASLLIDGPKDYDLARRILEDVVAQEPEYAVAYLNLGVIHLRQNEIPQAIDLFEKVLALEPSSHAGSYNLAAANFNLGDHQRAVEVLERAIAYWPGSALLHGLLGASWYELDEKERAGRSLRTALSIDPTSSIALRYLERLANEE